MLLRFENVSFSYSKDNFALKNINFNVKKGERIALLGLNGSGKSTLLLHINGLLKPTEGDIIVNEINTKSKDISNIRRIVGMVFQNPDDQLFMPTVKDDVAFGPRNMKLSQKEIENRVLRALELTGTSDLAAKAPFELSGGQKKSVCIATVLSMNPEMLILDEPTAGLDFIGRETFKTIIESLPHSMIMSTHDIEIARSLCTRAIILQKGSIVYDGPITGISSFFEK